MRPAPFRWIARVVTAACLACLLLAPPAWPQPRSPEPPPVPAGVEGEALADSLAAAVLAVPADPAARLAVFARAAALPGRPLVITAADTLGDELLLAVQVVPSPGLALRLVSPGGVRRVEGAVSASAATPAGIHALRRVWLARIRPLYEQPLTRVALAWFEEPGPAPFALWVAPVDSLPGARPGLARTALTSNERADGGAIRVLTRNGETTFSTVESNWRGAASVDAALCADCPHLRQETTWRLDGLQATRLQVRPVDDAAWAVARAFDARRGYRAWSDRDIVVSPVVDRWMRARRWAVLESVRPLGDGSARVVVSSRGSADTIGILARRTKRAGVPGWELTPAQ